MAGNHSSLSSGDTAQITVTRDSPDDVQTRQIIVSLDGQRKGELMFGDAITFSVSPGHHALRVDNTWNHQDLELEVVAGGQLRFVSKSHAGDFSKFLLVAFGAGPIYVSIEAEPPRRAP